MLLTAELIEQRLQITRGQAKTFVFDLDGTLIYKGKPLIPEFESLLCEIKAAGHEIIFATGRSWRDFRPIMPQWCHKVPCVLFGGGLTIANDEIQYQYFLRNDYLQDIIKLLDDRHAHYLVDGINNYYHPAKEHWLYSEIIELSGQSKAHNLDVIFNESAYKIMVLDDVWLAELKEFTQEKELIIKHHSYDCCFDVLPAGVNKHVGLSHLPLPGPENVFVFGNDHNDLELMHNFSNSVLFGNHKELLTYAKLQIDYDGDLVNNFSNVITTILKNS